MDLWLQRNYSAETMHSRGTLCPMYIVNCGREAIVTPDLKKQSKQDNVSLIINNETLADI